VVVLVLCRTAPPPALEEDLRTTHYLDVLPVTGGSVPRPVRMRERYDLSL
jgi:hypothetical protein